MRSLGTTTPPLRPFIRCRMYRYPPQKTPLVLRLVVSELASIWRIRCVRKVLYVAIPLMFCASMCFWLILARMFTNMHSCSDYNSQLFLEALCDKHLYGKVSGSLCEPLCVSREIRFKRCLGHGIKLHVLEAEWNAYTIILKAPGELGSRRAKEHIKGENRNKQLTREDFIQQVNVSLLLNTAGNRYSKAIVKLAGEIFDECDVLGDGVLEYSNEALACWQLVETDEYVLYSLLQGRKGIPDVYGVCGHVYAVQYAPSEPFLGFESSLHDHREWDFRVKLALGLLEMIESIEETPLGTLYLCDVQAANFGVVRRDGRLLAKAIDVDISFFEGQLHDIVKSEVNRNCTADADCYLINCEATCDLATGRCSGTLVSNNLQLLCQRILSKRRAFHPALLADPPKELQPELDRVLDKCATPGLTHVPHRVLEELRDLLEKSLHL